MENSQIVNATKGQNKLAIIGLVTLAIPLLVWILWIYTFSSNPNLSPEEKLERFLSFFPGFLHSPSSVSTVVLIFAIGSIIFSAFGRGKANDTFKVLGVFAIVVASAITLLQLFTML